MAGFGVLFSVCDGLVKRKKREKRKCVLNSGFQLLVKVHVI